MKEIKALRNIDRPTTKIYDLGGSARRIVIGGDNYLYKNDEGEILDYSPVPIESADGLLFKNQSLPVAIKEDGTRKVFFDQKLESWIEFGKLVPYDNKIELSASLSSIEGTSFSQINEDFEIEYVVTKKGTKFNLTLLNEKAPLKWKMSYIEHGVSYSDGKILKDLTNVAKMPDIRYWSEKEEKINSEIRTVKFTIKKDELIFEIDNTDLAYPIKIDPTVVVPSSSADSWVFSDWPDNADGVSTEGYAGYDNGGSREYESFIRFDYSSVPAGAVITNAYLSVYVDTSNLTGYTLNASRIINTGFVENEVTWNSKSTGVAWNTAGCRGIGTDIASNKTQIPMTDNATYYLELPITEQIVDLGEDRIYECLLWVNEFIASTKFVTIEFKEGGNPPILTIDYVTTDSIEHVVNDADSLMYQDQPNTNYENIGTPNSIIQLYADAVHCCRSIVRVDWSVIPVGATIVSATYRIYPVLMNATQTSDVAVYQIVNTGFVENEVTWNSKSTGVAWNTAGCGDSTLDYTTVNGATATLVIEVPNQLSFDITDQLVTLGDTRIWEGLIKYETDDAGAYYSQFGDKGHQLTSTRPSLDIIYNLGGPANDTASILLNLF